MEEQAAVVAELRRAFAVAQQRVVAAEQGRESVDAELEVLRELLAGDREQAQQASRADGQGVGAPGTVDGSSAVGPAGSGRAAAGAGFGLHRAPLQN